MRLRLLRRPLRGTGLVLLLVMAACGSGTVADPGNREVPWTYGPTTGGATAEHARGTGSDGGAAIAKGWQCRLQDSKRLVVRPYQPASSHPLSGKVKMVIGLFDKAGKDLATVVSPTVTAPAATFTFELEDAVAKNLWDVVIWYRAF